MFSRQIQQTLAEQLKINDRELNSRKALLEFTPKEAKLLSQFKPFFSQRIDDIVERFYQRQTSITEIALLIGDIDTLGRLKNAMRRYILDLFDGAYDNDYLNKRLRIGKIHQRIGVPPKLYISAIWLLENTLFEEIEEKLSKETGPEQIEALKKALNKLLTLDIQFVMDTYIASLVNEVTIAHKEMEQNVENLEVIVRERTKELEDLSRKDNLTQLYNQANFHSELRRVLNTAERYQDDLSIAYLDLNKFKELNDTQGHLAGNEALKAFSQLILQEVRETDYPCRCGGDEFAVIFPRSSIDAAVTFGERLKKALIQKPIGHLSFSMGLASTGPDQFVSADELITLADNCMYKAKNLAREKNESQVICHNVTLLKKKND